MQDIIYEKKKQNDPNNMKFSVEIKDWINNNNNNFNNNMKMNEGTNMRKDSFIETLEYNNTTFKPNKLNEKNRYIILPEICSNNNSVANFIKTVNLGVGFKHKKNNDNNEKDNIDISQKLPKIES